MDTARFDLTVALDYGQFYLTGVYLPDGDADLLLRCLEEAIEAFSTGLLVGPDGLVYESTTPGDEWRLQLWPAPAPIRPHRLQAWPGPAPAG